MSTDDGTTCGVCGATGQVEAFCESCGMLMSFRPPTVERPEAMVEAGADGARAEPAVTEPAVTEPAVSEPVVSEPPTAPLPASDPMVDPLGTTQNLDLSALGDPKVDDTADRRRRARELIVPVSDPAARVQQVSPVLPGRPEPATHTVRGPELDTFTAGPPCPWCSTPNPTDRHFCRRCAMLLAARPEPMRRPWWRRLFDGLRRRREIPYAGQRPRLRHGPGRLVRWLVLFAVLGVVAFAADAWAGTATTDVEDHFTHPKPVFASTVTASRSDPSEPIAHVHDGYNNTWWGTGESGDGAGVSIDATFDQPINLLDLVITPGAGIQQDAFTSQSRPQSIKVTLFRADGSSTATTINLADSPGAATFAVRGKDVVRIQFTIESAYNVQPSTGNTEVAIAEIEFFASSGGG